MFKKPFKVKSNIHMKGSDRKKLKLEILRSFPYLSPEYVKDIFPAKETITHVKIVTDSNETIQLYCRNKLPMLFSRDVKLYPTIYMLWEYPDMLPYFTTHSEVLPMLQGGAHLMVAGVALEKGPVTVNSFGRLNKHDTVFVNLLNNKAAVAVGETVMSSEEMFNSHNKGKAVSVIHIYGDELCKFGDVMPIPNYGIVTAQYAPKLRGVPQQQQQQQQQPDSSGGNNKGLFSNVATIKTAIFENSNNKKIGNNGNNGNNSAASNNNVITTQMSCMKLNNNQQHEDGDGDDDDDDINIAGPAPSGGGTAAKGGATYNVDMDTMLEYCFIKSLKTTVRDVKLPLVISNFYKLHMMPACPDGYELNVKKSSFKKISKFVQHMAANGIIEVIDMSPGVQGISYIHYTHEILRTFYDVYKSANDDRKTDAVISTPPIVNEMYTVTLTVLPIFQEFLIKKGKSLAAADARRYITEYIKKKNLRNLADPRLIRLDDPLKRILDVSSSNADGNIHTWETVIKGVFQKMGHSYKVTTVENCDILPAMERKGKLPLIDIRLLKKTGNKKVTIVDNLDYYNVNVKDFSHNCQVGAAASATINHPTNLKSAQVQIQGSQAAFVKKLLADKYQIPAKYIRELDTGVKAKK